MGFTKSLNWNKINENITIHKFCEPKIIKLIGIRSKDMSNMYHFLKFFSLEIMENNNAMKGKRKYDKAYEKNISEGIKPALVIYIGKKFKDNLLSLCLETLQKTKIKHFIFICCKNPKFNSTKRLGTLFKGV